MFKVTNLDHVGVGVGDLEKATKFYTEVLGMKSTGEEVVAEQKVKVRFIPAGQGEVELLESTAEDGPIAKYIAKNGGRDGIQHIALHVDNIEQALADLEAKGVPMIDKKPRYGAGGSDIAFIHPKATGGVLVELCQRKK